MTDYDFSQLNDKEFEILATDLLSLLFNKRIERFKPGRDKGVDGRFFSFDGNEMILQYKHYVKTGYSGLVSKLKTDELPNVRKISPSQYYLVTTVPLSRQNKNDIKNLFTPFIKSDNDIFGQEDLNDLLSKYPHIEEKHHKLWITSTNVLQRIMNNAIKGRSEYEIARFQKNSFKYVETSNHEAALKILKENRVIIITGEPGVGKTTLAENLCLHFASLGYEFIDIEESISEAENVYTPNKHQLFYFDDFLGSNYFEAIENKKDTHIMKFIDRIRSDKSKLFILTSRTNILNSGILHSPYLFNQKIRKDEFLLTITALTNIDKARILYNHLWHSTLESTFIDEIYKDKRYLRIVKHKNFNPRLIEFITDNDRLEVDSSNYWDYILATLNNPKDIWSECFKNQNNAFVRNIVLLTVFNGGSIIEEDLRSGYYKLCKLSGLINTSHTEKDFESMSRIATKSFLNRNMYSNKTQLELFNPSIADFVFNDYGKEVDKLIQVYMSLDTCKSLERLVSLEKEGILSSVMASKIKEAVFHNSFHDIKRIDYMISVSHMFMKDQDKRIQIISFLHKVIDDPQPIDELAKFFELLRKFWEEFKVTNWNFLKVCIENKALDLNEICQFSWLLEHSKCSDKGTLEILRNCIEYHINEELYDVVNDMDFSSVYTYCEGYDGDYDISIDTDRIESRLVDTMSRILYDFHSNLAEELAPSIEEIVSSFDIEQMVYDYINSIHSNDDDDFRWSPSSAGVDIEDLFERT